MSCFSGNTCDNWWVIILVLFLLCNDDCNGCLDCIRDIVCGENLVWIICLLLLCNSCGRGTSSSDMCGNRCNTCGCGCN